MKAWPFPMKGGLNLSGVTLALKPGEATLLENYECLPEGGYRRFDGFERYDGHPEPFKATYSLFPFTAGTGTPIVAGDTVAGVNSGASGHVLKVEITSGSFAAGTAAGTIIFDRPVGSFVTTEPIAVSSVVRCQKSGAVEPGSQLEDSYDEYTVLAADSARSLIGAVPGSGPILGVAVFKGKVYAFRNKNDGLSCSMYESSETGWVEVKAGLPPDGRYEFIVYNFKGAASSKALYGVSGTHKGFEWTGSVWTDITTGMANDKPTHLAAHKNYLFFSFPNGSLQNSGAGDPTGTWTPRTGAQEIGIGDEITGLKSLRGGVLAVYGDNSTHLLYGSGSSDWELKVHADESGAAAGSVQEGPGGAVAIDNRGLVPIAASQNFGDFDSAAVSQRVGKFLAARRGKLACSTTIRNKDQYRAYFIDGTALCVTYRGDRIVGYSDLQLPVVPTCAFNGDDDSGDEMVVIGATDGFIYRTDVGWSHDGEAIDCVLRTAADACGKPRTKKHYTKLSLQVATPRRINMLVQVEYDYSLEAPDASQVVESATSYSLGLWDAGKWDEMVWDSADERGGIAYPEVRIDGVGLAASVLLYHGQEIRPPHTIESGIFNFHERGFAK